MSQEIPNDFPDFSVSDSEREEDDSSIKNILVGGKKDCKKHLLKLETLNSKFLNIQSLAEDENVEFRFKTSSGTSFKNYIDVCRKINSELEMVLFEKGLVSVVSGISSKYIIQTVFKREHFFYYYLAQDYMVLNIDLNDLFSFIKKINKNESVEMIKMKGEDSITIKILNYDDIMHLYPSVSLSNYLSTLSSEYNNALYFPNSGVFNSTKNTKVRVYEFTAENNNAKLGIDIDNTSSYGYKSSIKIATLFFHKVLCFLIKNKIGKVCFKIFSSGNIEIKSISSLALQTAPAAAGGGGIDDTQQPSASSQKIIIYSSSSSIANAEEDEKIVDVILPLNILILILKFIGINKLSGILKIIPVNPKCFSIESIIFENTISRFCLKGKSK